MKNLVATVWLGLFILCVIGTARVYAAESVSESTNSGSTSLYAEEIAVYERAMGTDHGLSDLEIHKRMQALISNPVFQNRFLGIMTHQTPSDAWIILEIMAETRPDLIVEAGTFHGGSAVLWAIILQHINPGGRVITIDIEDQREARAINLPIAKRRVEFILGSSTDPKVVEKVHQRAKGKRVMVILDSLHSKEHVAAELEAYAPLVPVGGYLIVQDTPFGPDEAIAEFLAANDNWIADRRRERYPDTNSVRGYLRRVKP
jgi:cephalosporin hydroxylase